MVLKFFKDIFKMPLLAFTIFIVSFIGIFFNVPLMVPPFAATLFMVYLKSDSEFSQFKNIVGGHLIGFACAFLEPFITGYVSFFPENLSKAVIIGVSILIAGLLMVITRLEHPPAAATTLLFFGIEPEGYLLFNLVPLHAFISFLVGLAIVGVVTFYVQRKKKKEPVEKKPESKGRSEPEPQPLP